MSRQGERELVRKQGWAAPGGAHDRLIGFMKIALPSAVGAFLAYLALAPLNNSKEISFILDKNKVEVAKERMKVQAARYQGLDDEGRPFILAAQTAVQATSRAPIVDVIGISARIHLDNGPASMRANKGRYDLERETVNVVGPILLTGADGYRLQTRDVAVDLNSQVMESRGAVEGLLPLGRFTANRMTANLGQRKVTLDGRARLHIVQGGLR